MSLTALGKRRLLQAARKTLKMSSEGQRRHGGMSKEKAMEVVDELAAHKRKTGY
ncbi:hypothetical protein LCGC14_1981080 [marine sediment metagenome]|uniref:Uncharacterized protein n=1 Tax=marine sediment metagenome TaxID=412755 RepID=A0A0F9I5X5_9ZZZZ